MKRQDSTQADRRTSAPTTPTVPVPELPAWKAFVVQFSRETGTRRGLMAGRVEHLSSGRRARFTTPEELVTVLQTLIDEVCGTSVDRF